MKLLFFDVETTGTDPKIHAIHQLAGQIVIDGILKDAFNYKIKPHESAVIDPAALVICGVINFDGYSEPLTIHQTFTQLLAQYVSRFNKVDKFFLVGYNTQAFDIPFLRSFFDHNNDPYFGSFFWSASIDIMILASDHLKFHRPTMPNFKLHSVARELGIVVNDTSLHDAMYDVNLTRLIYEKISSKPPAEALAKKVKETLDMQQRFFKASRLGLSEKEAVLTASKKLESELSTMADQVLSVQQPIQNLLF